MYLYKIFLIILSFIFSLSSCKKEKDDNKNLLFLLLFGSNQNSGSTSSGNSGITFSGKFGNVSSSLNRNAKSLPNGITDVLAISAVNHYHRSKIDSSGNFSLNLVKGYPYILVFIDSANIVKGYYKLDSLSLNTIPTHYAGSKINGGEIEKSETGTSYSPKRNFNINEFLNQAGNLNSNEIDSIIVLGDQMLNLANIDTDGNGIIDLEEKLYLRLGFGQGWGWPGNSSFSLSSAFNQFFDISVLSSNSTGVTFGITIDKARVSDKNLKVRFPVPSGCTNSNNGEVTAQFDDGNSGLASANDTTGGSFKMGSQIYIGLGSFNCGGVISNTLSSGTYTVENSGKTYTYKNTTPFYISTDKTFIIPTIKFIVNGGLIDSIEYKYKKYTSGLVSDATSREVSLVYGADKLYRGAGIICRDANQTPWLFSCGFPKDSESGVISNCNSGSEVKTSTYKGVNFSTINNCNFYTYDAYGTYIGIGLFQ